MDRLCYKHAWAYAVISHPVQSCTSIIKQHSAPWLTYHADYYNTLCKAQLLPVRHLLPDGILDCLPRLLGNTMSVHSVEVKLVGLMPALFHPFAAGELQAHRCTVHVKM